MGLFSGSDIKETFLKSAKDLFDDIFNNSKTDKDLKTGRHVLVEFGVSKLMGT